MRMPCHRSGSAPAPREELRGDIVEHDRIARAERPHDGGHLRSRGSEGISLHRSHGVVARHHDEDVAVTRLAKGEASVAVRETNEAPDGRSGAGPSHR